MPVQFPLAHLRFLPDQRVFKIGSWRKDATFFCFLQSQIRTNLVEYAKDTRASVIKKLSEICCQRAHGLFGVR